MFAAYRWPLPCHAAAGVAAHSAAATAAPRRAIRAEHIECACRPLPGGGGNVVPIAEGRSNDPNWLMTDPSRVLRQTFVTRRVPVVKTTRAISTRD